MASEAHDFTPSPELRSLFREVAKRIHPDFCSDACDLERRTRFAEFYPTSVRGAGQALVYNIGRGASALAPFAVGAVASWKGIGAALALNSGFFLIGAILIFTLPETKNTDLR